MHASYIFSTLMVCLDLLEKNFEREFYYLEVLNKYIYKIFLQSANYGLSRLIKFISRFTTHLCKKNCK